MIIGRFLLALALAFVSESMSEYLFGIAFDLLAKRWPILADIQPMRYISLAVGMALALAYQLDIIFEAFGYVAFWPWTGVAVTGLVIGRGSNYLHAFYSRYLKPTVIDEEPPAAASC